MKPIKKIIDQPINPESVTVFGLPLKITPEIRDVTFSLSQTKPEKYKAIKQSIELANGKLDEPIKVIKLGSEQGDYYTIVDGHTRQEILNEIPNNLASDDENYTILTNIFSIQKAKELAYRLNHLRRQAEIYQDTVGAIKANPVSKEREIETISGISHSTINKVKYILGFTKPENITEAEKNQITQIYKDLASGTKGIDPVYKQFKVAEEVSNAIAIIEDSEFQNKMRTNYETLKFTDKNAMKKLQAEIDAHNAEAEGQDLTIDPYSKDIRPVMEKLIKLQEKHSGITTISCSGHQLAIDNALDSMRRYLLNHMNENIVEVLEGVRAVLIEELEQKEQKDLSVIMDKAAKILPVSENGYFLSAMQLPKAE